MKMFNFLALTCLASMLFCACNDQQNKTQFTPISGGFGIMAQWVGIDSGPKAELYYRTNGSKPVLIWPFLTGELLYTNDLFLFVGDIRDSEGRLGDSRYFAVQAPGPAVDISDDLLTWLAVSNRWNFGAVRRKYSPLKLKAVPAGIEVHFIGPDQQPNTLVINWQQISNIIYDVRQTGKKHFVEDPHAPYLKKDY